MTAAVPSALEVAHNGVLAPLGLEHVLLAVSDLERARRYYRFVYGEGLETRDADARELVDEYRIGRKPVALASKRLSSIRWSSKRSLARPLAWVSER